LRAIHIADKQFQEIRGLRKRIMGGRGKYTEDKRRGEKIGTTESTR